MFKFSGEMGKNKKEKETEMGSGDSDDEFYNVKLSTTPTATDKAFKKMEVRKVYSPPRTRVSYDYKFDSSSDEESESRKNESCDSREKKYDDIKSEKKNEEMPKENPNLSVNTSRVVEKINEELKNMKNSAGKTIPEKTETLTNPVAPSMASGVNVTRPSINVPPMVVVPPSMVVPQAPVMAPIMVPHGMPGAMNMMPSQIGIAGNMLRTGAPMGGLMAGANNMIGMNAVQAGMMGMQGNVMGLQPGMINPAAMNMAMRMSGAGNNMLRIQGTNGMMAIQGSAMMGIPPNGNIIGVPRPQSGMMGVQTPATGVMPNPAGMMVSSGNVAMMGNSGLMVMGGMMSNMGNVVTNMNPTVAVQPEINNPVRMVSNPSGNPPVRPSPPSFMNIRGKPPLPPNFNWQTNSRQPTNVPNTPVSPSGRDSNDRSSSSSPPDKYRDFDGDDYVKDEKEKALSDRSSTFDDESQSPPRELPNNFKNDGSFMEMFKKMKEECNKEGSSSSTKTSGSSDSSLTKKPPVVLSGIVGKRRGGRVLKTGLVKKVRKEVEAETEKNPKDAWSMYMAEVKKYREASCEEEGKTRPLVK